MSRHVFSLFLARIPVFFTICVTWDVIVDKVAEKPLEDQRVTFHFLCHPTRRRFTMKIENAIFDFHGSRSFYTVGFSVSRAVQCPPVSCWTFNKS